MINLCLIGAGRMGQSHAHTIYLHPEARLYSVVDPHRETAETVASKYGAKAYSIEEALSDSNVDGVVIASSADTHSALIELAASAGKPIFCEKPVDLDLERVDRCLAAVKQFGVPLLVAFNRRFDPSFRALKDRVQNEEIGEVELVSITNKDAIMPDVRFLRTSGGIFHDFTIHDFDTARWILGEEPTEIYATGSCLINSELAEFGDLDTAVIVLKTASGKIAQINNSRHCVYGYDQRVEVWGADGMLEVRNQTPTSVQAASKTGFSTDRIQPSFPQRFAEAYRLEIDHFIRDVVIDGKAPLVDGSDGRQNLIVANAAAESYRTGAPVKVDTGMSMTTA